jgi:hypothetical protein
LAGIESALREQYGVRRSERMLRHDRQRGVLGLEVGSAATTCGSAYFTMASSLAAYASWCQEQRPAAISSARSAAGRRGAASRWQPFVLVRPQDP